MADTTIAEKLTRLRNTKQSIAESIVAKGIEVLDTDTFASYATKIDDIDTSGNIYDGVINPSTGRSDLEIFPSKNNDINVLPPLGYDGIAYCLVDKVTNEIDSNIISDNIRLNVEVLGVVGSLVELNSQPTITVNPSNSIQTINPSNPYNSISQIVINAVNNEERVITPNTYTITVYPSSGYVGLSRVTVNAVTSAIDSNITAENIKKDIHILGVTGTYEPLLTPITINATTIQQTIDIPLNFDGYSTITVNPVTHEIDSNIVQGNIKKGITILGVLGTYELNNVQNKIINPTTSQQIITADAGYDALNQVTVNAVTSAIDSNITAENIKKDIHILGIVGSYDPLALLQEKTIDPLITYQSVTADAGYNGLLQVNITAVTSAIDSNITAENIKKDIVILGTTGTYEGEPYLYQTKTVTPTISLQSITADTGYDALNQVNILAVTSAIDSNIVSQNIKKGITILNVVGTLEASIKPYWFEFELTAVTLPIAPLGLGGFDSINATLTSFDSCTILPIIIQLTEGSNNIQPSLYTTVSGYDLVDIYEPYQHIIFPRADLYDESLGYIVANATTKELRAFSEGGLLINYVDDGSEISLNLYMLYNSSMYSGIPILVQGAMSDGLLPSGYTDYRYAKVIHIPTHTPLS